MIVTAFSSSFEQMSDKLKQAASLIQETTKLYRNYRDGIPSKIATLEKHIERDKESIESMQKALKELKEPVWKDFIPNNPINQQDAELEFHKAKGKHKQNKWDYEQGIIRAGDYIADNERKIQNLKDGIPETLKQLVNDIDKAVADLKKEVK